MTENWFQTRSVKLARLTYFFQPSTRSHYNRSSHRANAMARKIWLGNQVRPIILTRCAILTPRMTQPNAHPPSRFAQSGEDCAPKSDLFKCSRRRRSGEGGGEQLSWNFLFPTNAKILRHIQFKLMNSPPRNGRKLSQGSHHQFFSCSFFFFF